jgi:hypothetical protein
MHMLRPRFSVLLGKYLRNMGQDRGNVGVRFRAVRFGAEDSWQEWFLQVLI